MGEPPAWYSLLTIRRAIWQDFGATPENTNAENWARMSMAVQLEAKYKQSRKENRNSAQ